MAGIGWIDFSDAHRQRVHAVMDMITGGTVDELGVGVVRDSIANWLFPGISTIQTRPKYFIIIPALILEYLRKWSNEEKVPKLSSYLNQRENEVMGWLAENYQYKENNGVIGIHVALRNEELARKPSVIYWNGLRTHGIIPTHYSLGQYLDKNDLSGITYKKSKEEDNYLLEELEFGRLNDFPVVTSDVRLDLSAEEAGFLKHHFIGENGLHKPKNNLLGQVLLHPEVGTLLREAFSFRDMAEKILAAKLLPRETMKVLRIALDFDFLMHGAHIRYNILLHKQSGTQDFSDRWTAWQQALEQQHETLEDFHFPTVFAEIAPQTRLPTRLFMENWHQAVLANSQDTERLDQLVFTQEKYNKGAKAKLMRKSEQHDKWVGIDGLDYRFFQVRTLVKDLYTALEHA